MNDSAIACIRLEVAELLLAKRRVDEALTAFDEAQALGAELDRCDGGRWMAFMLLGHFEQAWRCSDRIAARYAFDSHRYWDGKPLRGKRVIVSCLHGFGDAVQNLRYATELSRIATKVTFEMHPSLVPLARCISKVENVIAWDQNVQSVAPDWESQIEITELPYIFRTTMKDLPVSSNYLQIPAMSSEVAAKQIHSATHGGTGKLRVGLAWTGGAWDLSRSVPLRYFESLLSVPQIEFWNLQLESSDSDALEKKMHHAATHCGEGLVALAATIAHLDLVISIDTLAAHLAGAMGKPVWLMLQYAADWRWMLDREDSPWYPTMRIFRQSLPEDWAGVVGAVTSSLQQMARGKL